MTALIPIEGIGAAEGVDWRAGPVKGATMGFKNFLNKQPKMMIRGASHLITILGLFLLRIFKTHGCTLHGSCS